MQIRSDRKTAKQIVKDRSSSSVSHTKELIASSGVTFQLWRLYQHAWLVCLLFPLISIVQNPLSSWQVVVRGLALLGFAAGYTWLMWAHPVSQNRWTQAHFWLALVLFGALAILVLTFSLFYGPAWLWLFIGVSAIAGVLLPLRRAFIAIVILTLLPLFLVVTLHGGINNVDLWWLLALMLLVRGLGLDMIGVTRMGGALRELHLARQELARLAVIEERERLSRDLHDLLGQTLSMITLKSELARCLVAEEPERCAQELTEIECAARQTLREVRKTVAGYRQPTLAHELDGARQILEAAGILYDIEQPDCAFAPACDTILAWTVREGVTNVIHHSHARRCWVHLIQNQEWTGIEVLNDGEPRERSVQKQAHRGNGLPGLRERADVLGGTIEAGWFTLAGRPHFRLRVTFSASRNRELSRDEED